MKRESPKKNQSCAHARISRRMLRTAGNEGQSFVDVTSHIRIEVGKADEPSLLANQRQDSCLSAIATRWRFCSKELDRGATVRKLFEGAWSKTECKMKHESVPKVLEKKTFTLEG